MSKRADEYGSATPATGDTLIGIDASDLTDSAAGTVKQFPFTDFQPRDSDLTALAALTTTAFGRALLELADAAALRTAGGLGDLAVLSAVTASLIFDASANGRSLITAADYSAMRTLLGLVIGTNVQAQDAELAALAGLTSAADKGIQFTGAGTAGTFDLTAAGKALLDDADATAQRETLFGAATAITGGGTLALGGFTLTVPATGSAALLATANVFSAAQNTTITDAVTNTVTTLLTLDHESSGTPAASFGARILFQLEDNTTPTQDAAAIDVIWSTATHASHASQFKFFVATAGGAATSESIRLDSTGISAIGGNTNGTLSASFLQLSNPGGAATIAQSATNANAALNLKGSTTIATGQYIGFAFGAVETARFDVLSANVSTAAVVDNLILRRNPTSGTPAAGTGQQIHFVGKTDTTANRDQLAISTEWVVATEASQTTRVKFNVFDTAAREAIRIEASGSAPMIGVLGAAAVVRQTGGENLTNSVTSGGTDGTITNWTDLNTYATDAAAIRNAIYQLARALKQDHDALRLYGFLT